MLSRLHSLPTASLQSLAASLEGGLLSAGLSRFALQQIAGTDAASIEAELEGLVRSGFSTSQVAVLIRAIVDARHFRADPSHIVDLVLSGPDLPGVPTADTAAVVQTLIEQAKREVLLVGYAIHNVRSLFAPLAARMTQIPGLRVTFCIDIPRARGDASSDAMIVQAFAREFRIRHWPWPQLPSVYFDPRALMGDVGRRASLHAKCVVIDREQALVTSANFTQAGQHRNIEAGVLIRHNPTANRLTEYFAGLIDSGQLVRCDLDRVDEDQSASGSNAGNE